MLNSSLLILKGSQELLRLLHEFEICSFNIRNETIRIFLIQF